MTNLVLSNISLSPEDNLSRYLAEIRKFPILEAEEEYILAKRWQDVQDVEAAHKLVTSHLRLVVKIAQSFRGYGLALAEMIAEGNIGLMQAVKKFEPEKGFRLSTYAMWWIKASIQEYVLKSWSMVRIGTNAAQKKLFFNLRKMKSRIQATEDRNLTPEEISEIAIDLDVSQSDVIDMDRRLSSPDFYLHTPMGDNDDGQWIDNLEDTRPSHEVLLLEHDDMKHKKAIFKQALEHLSEREKEILFARRMSEPPLTLDDLSHKFDISKERVRQIENKAFEKLQSLVLQKI
jgi:RNA polymerase sigma-32 factor